MILAILLGSLLAFAVFYLIAQFVHGLRDFDIDDLEPLENGRRPR